MFEWEKCHLEELHQILNNINMEKKCRDYWILEFDMSGGFSVNSAYKAIHLDLVGM